MNELKELRQKNNVTQKYCADFLGVSLRTYKSYENDIKKVNTFKYRYLLEKMHECFKVDETTGVLTLAQIKSISQPILAKYNVEYCYLFGSYAKETANPNSDIDLLIFSNISGLKFYELAEILREKLHKKIDLLNYSQLANNPELINEVLKYGVKIYG